MRQNSGPEKQPAEDAIRDIRRATRRHFSAEERGQALYHKPNRGMTGEGVIHPKEVDPPIEKPAPKTGDPNVVPPPGSSGGAPAPQAK
jgi:hypothetical protein